LQVKHNGNFITCDLMVKPLDEPDFMRGLLMAVFRETTPGRAGRIKGRAPTRNEVVEELEKEIKYLQETLQTTNEEMETSQEELKSANEELQSTNEELQSSNEELTTSKEELQSLNEELLTVNSELQTKIDELTQSNNDMRNLLNSTEIATIFLDNAMNVKRFTSQATRLFNLIQTDVGRPLAHLVSNLRYGRLANDVREVVETLVFKEVQVQGTDNRWYSLRIIPYRTAENVIDGAVLTFQDITTLKALEAELRHLAAIVESSGDAIIGENLDGVIISWNRGAELLFGYPAGEARGKPISIIVPPERLAELDELTERVKKGEKVDSSESVRKRKNGAKVCVSQTVSPIRDAAGEIIGASLIIRECIGKG
ncbi:MAG TPA: PAS domain-containing protein, partial [Geobacteraceae bacterium]